MCFSVRCINGQTELKHAIEMNERTYLVDAYELIKIPSTPILRINRKLAELNWLVLLVPVWQSFRLTTLKAIDTH